MGHGTKAELEAAGLLEGVGAYGDALRILLGDVAPARPAWDRGGVWCRHFCRACWVTWSHAKAPTRCPDRDAFSVVCGDCRDLQERIYVEDLR